MLTSKEIIEKTGISRATLNNYIAAGMVPRPDVLPPAPDDGLGPRIGYFPDNTVDRILAIQSLKKEGRTIGEIAQLFAGSADQQPKPAGGARVAAAPPASQPPGGHGTVERRDRGKASTPQLVSVAVLATELQDAPELWARLPVLEYFELVNEIWVGTDHVLRRHGGMPVGNVDTGLLCHFSAGANSSYSCSAVAAAYGLQDVVRHVRQTWQSRKGWDLGLFLNTGVDEGQDWVGAIGLEPHRVLGNAAELTRQMAQCSREGVILVTRNLVEKLSAQERARIVFGVSRALNPVAKDRVLGVFAPLREIAGLPVPPRFMDTPVAQIFGIVSSPRGSLPAGAANL